MRHALSIALFVVALSPLVACGDSSADGSGGSGSGACKSTEVDVEYLGGTKDGTKKCVAIPSACNGKASCSDQACEGALYDLCTDSYIGVGCSDTVAPTIVSCNP